MTEPQVYTGKLEEAGEKFSVTLWRIVMLKAGIPYLMASPHPGYDSVVSRV